MELWTAFTIGALGSFHCIGMCGPIALALPVHNGGNGKKIMGSLVYNLGRVSTYAIFGAIFGTVGKGFSLFSSQQWLSVALGGLIVISVVVPTAFKNRLNPASSISRGIGKIKGGMQHFFRQRSYRALFSIGLLNGLLPCGMVYLAVAGAVATGDSLSGAAYMALFGLGTLPVMWGTVLAGNMISLRLRGLIRRSMPVVIACIGILFIIRGLNLGIPYVSPKMEAKSASVEKCH
jgi:uncharacterized protein